MLSTRAPDQLCVRSFDSASAASQSTTPRNPPGGIVDVEQATFRAEARNDEQSSGIEVTALERRLGRICKAHQREPTAQLGPEREQRDKATAHDQRTAAVATEPAAPQPDSGLSDAI